MVLGELRYCNMVLLFYRQRKQNRAISGDSNLHFMCAGFVSLDMATQTDNFFRAVFFYIPAADYDVLRGNAVCGGSLYITNFQAGVKMAICKKANTYYAYFRDIDGRQVLRSLHTGDRAVAEVREKAMRDHIKEVKFLAMIQRMRPDEPQITTAFPKKQAPSPGEHQRDGKTFNNVKSYLNTIFRFCLIEAGLTDSPFKPVANRRVKKEKTKPWRNLTLDEFDTALKNASTEYMRIMMMLSRWTAQRLETCARMTPEMFDFGQLAFIIDPGKLKRFDKWVCCPIMPELENFIKPILARCKDTTAPIVKNFDYPGNKKMSEYFTAHLRKNNIINTECDRVGFHSLRGTAITMPLYQKYAYWMDYIPLHYGKLI